MSMKCVQLPNGRIVRIKTSLADFLHHKYPEFIHYINKRAWRMQKLSDSINMRLSNETR